MEMDALLDVKTNIVEMELSIIIINKIAIIKQIV